MQPSESEQSITRKIKGSASLMDILLLDHLIIDKDDYYSLADNGLL